MVVRANKFKTKEKSYDRLIKGAWGCLGSQRRRGRDKLRKAAGNGTYILIRRYPNGATRYVEDITTLAWSKPRELKHLSTRRRRKQK